MYRRRTHHSKSYLALLRLYLIRIHLGTSFRHCIKLYVYTTTVYIKASEKKHIIINEVLNVKNLVINSFLHSKGNLAKTPLSLDLENRENIWPTLNSLVI